MNKLGGSVCLIFILAGVASVPRTGPTVRTLSQPSTPYSTQKLALRDRLIAAYDHLAAGRYLQAAMAYETACPEAVALKQLEWAGRCWNNLGSARFAMFRYRAALDALLTARQCSQSAGDWANLANLGSNTSALYLLLGDLDAAAHAADEGLANLDRKEFPGSRSRFLIQLAVIRARQGRLAESQAHIAQAMAIADREGDFNALAEAWDHLGEEYLLQRALQQADRALTEAFRLRKVHGLNKLDCSYWNLGRLRLEQGDPVSAEHLLDAAILRRQHPDSLTSLWSVYHTRGRARLTLRRVTDAFRDFRTALQLARRWRIEVVPADATRVGSEVQLQEIYASFIEAGNQLYFRTGRQGLARETFRAAEENRASSLHALLREPRDGGQALPAQYWETLAQMRAAEAALLREDNTALREKSRRLLTTLLEFEAKAGSPIDLASEDLDERTARSLRPDRVLLSFHLGEPHSYLWAITRHHFRLYRLPPKSELTTDILRFSTAVRTGEPSAKPLGQALYKSLFGQVGTQFRDRPHWILALDEQLFRVPFSALVADGNTPALVYLAQRHSLHVATGAVMLAAGQAVSWREALAGVFLGVGDAIYNTADPRWKSSPQGWVGIRRAAFTRSSALPQDEGLARLVGSAREIEACARAWNSRAGRAVFLEGADASPEVFRQALAAHPSVIHFAAHFLEARQPPRSSLIALSLAASGDPQLLSALDITRSNIRTGLVVLSGCGSGRADVLPASGPMGLTRAWLAAGAEAVVASYWPARDDTGDLFVNFYQNLRETPDAGPAAALQRAQLAMLRAGGWRSNPQYWATYFVVGHL